MPRGEAWLRRHVPSGKGAKQGNQVFYVVRDPLLLDVLDTLRRYFQTHIEESLSMLKEIEQQEAVVK